ncbi:hypothetical protein BH11ARM1_BH11ARM1_13490 [soil metagenome]
MKHLPPIFVVTGAPAVGKSTFCTELMQRFDLGFHVPVDNLRDWVVSGIANPLNWCDETSRQFKLAELAAADVARRYNDAGFAVAIDHCQELPVLDELILESLPGRKVIRIALTCDLEVNLQRNRDRTNKTFDHQILVATIENLNPKYREPEKVDAQWNTIENHPNRLYEAIDRAIELADGPLGQRSL